MNQAVKGNPQYKTEHQGRTYHFANADAKKMFDAAPATYVPATTVGARRPLPKA